MKSVLIFIYLFIGPAAIGQSGQALIAEAVQLEVNFQEAAALEKLTQVLQNDPSNYFALWKSSELCSRLGVAQTTQSGQLAYYTTGKQYAENAIKARPDDAEGYYVLSVAMGRLALTGPNKEKIAAVKAIKANAEQALHLNADHGRAWHVLGKWHYEVSGLNLIERTAVKLFYGGFPQASIEESIRSYEMAQRLEPHFALNHLELARAYIRKGKMDKAKALLQRLAALPNKTGDDSRVKAEGRALLKSLQ